MIKFQSLMKAALISGALAGLVLFVYQYFVMVPRIIAAEAYETAGESAEHSSHDHEAEEWKPAEGFERTFYTAASTLLTGAGFASILFPIIVLNGSPSTLRKGLLWGLAGFACFVAAPALGLPPEPPGVPVADITARQLWWAATVVLTGAGLFLIFASHRGKLAKLIGVVCLLAPHAIGAPQAIGQNPVPEHFLREFAIASIAGNAIFWCVLGFCAGLFLKQQDDPQWGQGSADATRSAARV